jgi:hypothetical protein
VSDRHHKADQLNVLTAISRYQVDPHTVLDLVLASPDRETATATLMHTFGIDKPAAVAILNVQLFQLTTKSIGDTASMVDSLSAETA